MGMYTELRLAARIKKDTAPEIISLIKALCQGNGTQYLEQSGAQPPDHPFFATDRWSWMLHCDSYYFAAATHSELAYDDIANQHFLTVQCNLKKYTGEIEHFLNWIDQYLDCEPGEFIGFKRYEEAEHPTLLYAGGIERNIKD